MSGPNTASQVGTRFDVIIDGYGYMNDRTWNPDSLRHPPSSYQYTPTFVERTNVSGSYGDDQQAFWLTASQNDWSLGEGQRHLRLSGDATSIRQYFADTGVDVSTPGQVTLKFGIQGITTAANVKAGCARGVAAPTGHAFATNTNLYTSTAAGAITDQSTHGAGNVNQWGVCTDGVNIYIAGATKIRKWSSGGGYSDFSAQANAGALVFLNNALYSCDGSVLRVYSSTGTATTVFTWNDATGTALPALATHPKIIPLGGQLLIYWPFLYDRPELWLYDGSSTYRVAELPDSAIGYDIEEIEGVTFLSGSIYGTDAVAESLGGFPILWTYVGGNLDELWRGRASNVNHSQNDGLMPTLGSFSGRLSFTDMTRSGGSTGYLMEYDPTTGAVSSAGTFTLTGAGGAASQMSSAASSVLLSFDAASGVPKACLYPNLFGGVPIAATIDSSLIDFDNSLTKLFRGIKIDWDGAAPAAPDIYYQIDSVDGAYTLLQAAAASGTEYALPATTTGHSISVRVALNVVSGVSRLKHVYARAAPILPSYRIARLILDCTGVESDPSGGGDSDMLQLRDGTTHNLTGLQMATQLRATATMQTPVTITDEFATYTGIIEASTFQLERIRPAEYRAFVDLREI